MYYQLNMRSDQSPDQGWKSIIGIQCGKVIQFLYILNFPYQDCFLHPPLMMGSRYSENFLQYRSTTFYELAFSIQLFLLILASSAQTWIAKSPICHATPRHRHVDIVPSRQFGTLTRRNATPRHNTARRRAARSNLTVFLRSLRPLAAVAHQTAEQSAFKGVRLMLSQAEG